MRRTPFPTRQLPLHLAVGEEIVMLSPRQRRELVAALTELLMRAAQHNDNDDAEEKSSER